MLFRLVALIVLTLLPAVSDAQAVKRVALLIGNQAYAAEVGRLKNPINDVNLIAASLRKIGFAKDDIRIVRNGTRRDILRAIDAHAEKLRNAGSDAIGFMYYSGHGAANKRNRRNYLIPVGVKRLDGSVWYDAIPLDTVVTTLSDLAANAAHFVIFDACRNLLNMPTKGAKGFVPVSMRRGMFIAFSTDPGETASDEGQGSGPYAGALATELLKLGQDHLDVFQNVKEAVYLKTKVQVPWERNGLLQRVYLAERRIAALQRDPETRTQTEIEGAESEAARKRKVQEAAERARIEKEAKEAAQRHQEQQRRLSEAAQKILFELRCYRGRIDGKFLKGSRAAWQRATGEAFGNRELREQDIGRLNAVKSTVCQRRPPPPPPPTDTPRPKPTPKCIVVEGVRLC